MQKKIYPFEFWAIPKLVQSDKRLTPIDKDVFSVLFTRMNGENEARVKQKTIAIDLGINVISVKRAIKKLDKLGMIDSVRMGNSLCNRYEITMKS